MSVKDQQALDRLYAIDNVLTIEITMPQADWDAVRTEQPAGGLCNFDWTGDSRYTWRQATSVKISGTSFPASTTFTGVGVKKKSFCGSINSDKPCLHIDFGKIQRHHRLGGRRPDRVPLPDTQQLRPGSVLRSTATGLHLARHGRAAALAMQFRPGAGQRQADRPGRAGVNGPGVYVNTEPIMKRYIERNFNGNLNGNLYELEHRDDFISARIPFIGVESLSKFDDKADLKLADDQIAAHGLAGASQMLDLDQFIKIYAMEFLLKHWDGYSDNTNNTYLYNDVTAVASPGPGNVKFKLIPWGIDQILQPQHSFKMSTNGLIAKLVRNDATRRAQLIDQIRTYRDTIFAREVQQATLKPMIDRMETLLVGFGVPNAVAQIAVVRQQLRLAASAGYLCAGLPETQAGLRPQGRHQRVPARQQHRRDPGRATEPGELRDLPSPAPRQQRPHRPVALQRRSETGSRQPARPSAAFSTPRTPSSTAQGHKYLYTCPTNNTDHAEEFSITPVDTPDSFTFSGYFQLVSVRTRLGVAYGTETTPGGRPRIYQDPGGSRLYFY